MRISYPEPMKKAKFQVLVPNQAPESVHICGNHEHLGSWKEHLTMKKAGEDLYEFQCELPSDSIIEYKYSLGDWESVELDRENQTTENRALRERQRSVKDQVHHFPMEQFRETQSLEDILVIDDFESKILQNRRKLFILPPDGMEPARSYPALYLHDGNNLFFSELAFGGISWGFQRVVKELTRRKILAPLYLVGISNNHQREEEYTPVKWRGKGGRGDLYLNFLTDEVLPKIETHFAVDGSQRGLAGSSYGGLITLFAALQKPEFFRNYAVLSPSLAWGNRFIQKKFSKGARIEGNLWMDMGDLEFGIGKTGRDYQKRSHDLHDTFLENSSIRGNYHYYIHKQGAHNERSWFERLALWLPFLYPGEKYTEDWLKKTKPGSWPHKLWSEYP